MAQYSYADCLQSSYRVNWKISDVLDGHRFDPSRRWLPPQLSGADAIVSLSAEEKIKLSHVEMGAYAHLFGYVEEFIAPKMVALARDFEIDQREAFDALTNFAAEEVKHMNLFRELRSRLDAAVGFPLAVTAAIRAVEVLRVPEAIGRRRFSGWLRSASTSSRSLMSVRMRAAALCIRSR
jgi:hypothetical protein